MKKIILLVRHAKSGWNDASLSDIERKLTDRGKSDAKMMAKRLQKREIEIDGFVSSPAKRASKTAKIFMKEYDKNKKKLQLIPSLYEASVVDFYNAVESLDNDYKAVALFSHNPGITDFVNSLDCQPVYDMPTCAVFALEVKLKNWKDFREAKKEFLFFDYPKNEE
ncbi:MAG: SixA phosphatase family protein [Ginsengibacter sp.]|jgi:phosphohistidine phosphatase